MSTSVAVSTPSKPRVSDRALARAQAISGLVFAVFLAMHLITAASSIGGERSYDGVLATVRHYYRFPAIEIAGVIGAALVHLGSGVWRIVRRRRERHGRPAPFVPLRLRLHRYAGYYIMAAFPGHVIATRAPSLIFGQDPNFAFLAFSLKTVPYFFFPYYALLAFAGGYHLVHGVLAALKVIGAKLPGRSTSPKSPVFWGFAALWSAVALGIVLAFGGVLFRIDLSRLAQWQALWDRLHG